jgi:hypothetical protein
MIVYRTFSGRVNAALDVVRQQNVVRNELAAFLNDVQANHYKIIQVSEVVVPESELFSVTVWYSQPEQKPAVDFGHDPKAQSADVLAQALREKNRRDMLTTMVDEHMLRSDSS